MHPLVWEAPVAASLVVPFAPKAHVASSYYLVHRKADGTRPEVRAFVEWVSAEMASFVRLASARAKERAGLARPFGQLTARRLARLESAPTDGFTHEGFDGWMAAVLVLAWRRRLWAR